MNHDNLLFPEIPELSGTNCSVISGKENISTGYFGYCSDESRLSGNIPDKLYFPKNMIELSFAIREIAARGERACISGGRTGIAGGAVNLEAENVISLERLIFEPEIKYDQAASCWSVRVGAGQKLSDLNEVLKKRSRFPIDAPNGLFFPVDPTEESATVGGMAAVNASGAGTLFYGPTRDWIIGLTLVFADGRILRLRRGVKKAEYGRFGFLASDGELKISEIPNIKMPQTKHVAAYFLKEDLDLIDLFIGGEGTLAVIAEVQFRLALKPKNCLHLSIFASENVDCAEFSQYLKKASANRLICLEYMDRNSLEVLREYRDELGESSHVPQQACSAGSLYFLEIPFAKKEDLSVIWDFLLKGMQQYGISPDSTWAGFSAKDREAMKKFRHALPERINQLVSREKAEIPELTKVATDMAVPDQNLGQMMEIYIQNLQACGLKHVIFGHLGNGHLHVNIIPDSPQKLKEAKALYRHFAKKAVELGGSVAAEHGIGRIKREFLEIQFQPDEIQGMRNLKTFFDPAFRLNPGVLFTFQLST